MGSDSELTYVPAVELARLMRAKELSPVELMESKLARIEALNPERRSPAPDMNALAHTRQTCCPTSIVVDCGEVSRANT